MHGQNSSNLKCPKIQRANWLNLGGCDNWKFQFYEFETVKVLVVTLLQKNIINSWLRLPTLKFLKIWLRLPSLLKSDSNSQVHEWICYRLQSCSSHLSNNIFWNVSVFYFFSWTSIWCWWSSCVLPGLCSVQRPTLTSSM